MVTLKKNGTSVSLTLKDKSSALIVEALDLGNSRKGISEPQLIEKADAQGRVDPKT